MHHEEHEGHEEYKYEKISILMIREGLRLESEGL